jgi:hypothetical protein
LFILLEGSFASKANQIGGNPHFTKEIRQYREKDGLKNKLVTE